MSRQQGAAFARKMRKKLIRFAGHVKYQYAFRASKSMNRTSGFIFILVHYYFIISCHVISDFLEQCLFYDYKKYFFMLLEVYYYYIR